jgi:hypothetical protein
MEQQELNLRRKGKKQIVVDPVDIGKLESVLDNLMYVNRTNGTVFMPEDSKDIKPFLLSEIVKYLESVIETAVEENPQGAKYYRLTD